MTPRLASEALEAGKNRLEKICELIENCKYSVHDLSLSEAKEKGEVFRMNMPFELGIDLGRRLAPDPETNDKKFLIFEHHQYDLKRALSDLAGVDPMAHEGDFSTIIEKLRDFFRVEAEAELPGAEKLENEFYDFQAWMIEKKLFEGLTEREALKCPLKERLDEMVTWNDIGRPIDFEPN